jgi:RHS repeat-associated protein
LVDLVVKRTGTCTAGKCNQRFAYRWDEEGKLASARRWDYTTIPAGEPVHPNLPARAADWEDRYAYSGMGRTLKTDRNAAGVERHTLEISGTLRVQRAVFDAGTLDYTETAENEVVFLPGIGRAQYVANGMPIRAAADKLHIFYELGDTLGSTSVVFDKATSELVESVTHDAWGKTESDYRPARWAGFREDYRFTQKEEDIEVGATYFGARYYSPYLGRWLSPDPLTIHAGGADPNPYAYVGGWLGKATDPLGLDQVTRSDDGGPWVDYGSDWAPITAAPSPEPEEKSDGKAGKKAQDALDAVIDDLFEQKWGHALARVPDRAMQPSDTQRYQAFAIGGVNGGLDVLLASNPWLGGLRLTPPKNDNWYAQHVLNGDSDGGRKGSRFGITVALTVIGGELLGGLSEVKAGTGLASEASAAGSTAGEIGSGGRRLIPTLGNLGDDAEGIVAGSLGKGPNGYTLGGQVAEGSFDFVVQDGQVIVGRGHAALSGGGRVTYAGEVTLQDGQIVEWSNASGHFRPAAAFAPNAGLPMGSFRPVQFPALVGGPQLPVFH